MSEIWTLLTQTPQSFKGGDIWTVISGIHTAMVGIGYGLLVLFFAMGVFQSAASFRDFQRPEFALRHFIRFILAKVAVGSCMEIMTAIFSVCGGVVAAVMGSVGGSVSTVATLPSEIVTAIEGLGLLASIPLWLVSLLGSLFITVMSFILLLTVCMEGAVIVLACLIYSAFLSSSTPAADASLPAVTMAWQYIGQLIFNMLILTGLVKGADRVVKEMLGL